LHHLTRQVLTTRLLISGQSFVFLFRRSFVTNCIFLTQHGHPKTVIDLCPVHTHQRKSRHGRRCPFIYDGVSQSRHETK